MDSSQPPRMELCSAQYTATLVPVADGTPIVSIAAQGSHPTGGYETVFHKSPLEVYPPEFSLWHLKPTEVPREPNGHAGAVPFTKFTSFQAHGKIAKVRITDAAGIHEVPITGIAQAYFQAATKTIIGPKVRVDAAKTQPCYADSCANRVELSVTLPIGATYLATHYFTTADYPDDRADVYETGAKEVAWARFSEAVHSLNNNGQDVVTVYYYNRSTRTRWASINVDYT